jgi:hypothetical protein
MLTKERKEREEEIRDSMHERLEAYNRNEDPTPHFWAESCAALFDEIDRLRDDLKTFIDIAGCALEENLKLKRTIEGLSR